MTSMTMRVQIRWTSVIALACSLVGATLAFGIFFATFSRTHVVEDYMSIDSGTGYALTRMFPQERMLLATAGLLVLLALLVWIAGLVVEWRNRSK